MAIKKKEAQIKLELNLPLRELAQAVAALDSTVKILDFIREILNQRADISLDEQLAVLVWETIQGSYADDDPDKPHRIEDLIQ